MAVYFYRDDRPRDRSCQCAAFLARPWKRLAELKEKHWREALEADPLATFRASEALWERLVETGYVADEKQRRADFAAHLRLRALLDQTRNVKAR